MTREELDAMGPAITVRDLSEDGTGPWRLFIGDYGVATWPSSPAREDPRAYAEEVERCVREALAAPGATPHPEAQALGRELHALLDQPLPCKHTVGDLILTGPEGREVTKCGACLAARESRRSQEVARRVFGALSPHRQKLADEGHCMADGDGYCIWSGCPQNRDGEPGKTGRHCPRDLATRQWLDADGEGKAGEG